MNWKQTKFLIACVIVAYLYFIAILYGPELVRWLIAILSMAAMFFLGISVIATWAAQFYKKLGD